MATIDVMLKRYEIESLTVRIDHMTQVVMFQTKGTKNLYKNPFTALKVALTESGLTEDTVNELIEKTQKDTISRVKKNSLN